MSARRENVQQVIEATHEANGNYGWIGWDDLRATATRLNLSLTASQWKWKDVFEAICFGLLLDGKIKAKRDPYRRLGVLVKSTLWEQI